MAKRIVPGMMASAKIMLPNTMATINISFIFSLTLPT
jgi:hypothetical protein